MSRAAFFALLCILRCQTVAAQPSYPQQYFINPLKIPMLLAGNFGECRPGHFHSGLDIKTQGKENLPVYAAADGYVSRIKMEPGGFGHAIYISHPNGYTTLYAHLNDFYKELQDLVHREQYARKSWELDLNFPPEKFPLKQGQLIAYSGNTGGSTAPHLHFEIRDSKTEHPLNPQLFGFTIEDNKAPVPTELVLYDADKSIYDQTPKRVLLRNTGKLFEPKTAILLSQNNCLPGIAVNDYMNGSDNTLSFYQISWYWNDSLAGSIRLDDIGYDETRYLNACADYTLHFETGIWFNSLFVLKGNGLSRLYQINMPQLQLRDSNQLRILIQDNSGNESAVRCTVLKTGSDTTRQHCTQKWQSAEPKHFESPGITADFKSGSIYDDLCFEYERAYSANGISPIHTLHQPRVPLHSAFDLILQADRAVPFRLQKKVCLRYTDGKDSAGKASSFTEQRYQSSYRNFGRFWLEIDTTAPTIRLLRQSSKELRIEVRDQQTAVAKVTGVVKASGQWLCFERHGREWFYKSDEYTPAKGATIIRVEAIDELGNRSVKDFTLRR